MSSHDWVLPETGPTAPVDDPTAPKGARRRRRTLALVGGGLVGLLATLWLVGYLVAGENLPRNASVAGVAVGGLDREQARAKLVEELGPRAAEPLQVRAADRTGTVDPAEAGLSVDYPASVAAAGGGWSLDPRKIITVLTGGRAVDAVVRTDEDKLQAAVAGLADELDREPRDADLSYDDDDEATLKRTAARPGVTVEQEAAASALEAGYPTASPVELPTAVSDPEVTDAEADQVATAYAEPAVSGPVTVSAGSAGSFRVTPAMIAAALSFEPQDGTLAPRLDPDELSQAASRATAEVESTRPKDAGVRIVGGKPQVVPAVDGTAVAAADLARAVEPALTRTGDERRGTVPLTGKKAAFTTEEAEQLGVKQVTGQFTTRFPYLPYRNVNIGRAAELINDTLVKPGEEFSLNKVVGERTRANGFTEGLIISGGKFKRELGGGVSQSATTTFNAAFFAGMTDVEHQPHTLYINRYPAGREATVAWPNLDMRFRNDTKYGVVVQTAFRKASPGQQGSITVRIWSTPTWDKVTSSKITRSNFTTGRDITSSSPDCEPSDPVPGFDADYERQFWSGGSIVKREKFSWRYAPTDRITCT